MAFGFNLGLGLSAQMRGGGVPANALLTADSEPLLTADGEYILLEDTA